MWREFIFPPILDWPWSLVPFLPSYAKCFLVFVLRRVHMFHCYLWCDYSISIVVTLTRIIKSVVTGQAPVTLALRNAPGKNTNNPRWYTHISQLTQFMPPPETFKFMASVCAYLIYFLSSSRSHAFNERWQWFRISNGIDFRFMAWIFWGGCTPGLLDLSDCHNLDHVFSDRRRRSLRE